MVGNQLNPPDGPRGPLSRNTQVPWSLDSSPVRVVAQIRKERSDRVGTIESLNIMNAKFEIQIHPNWPLQESLLTGKTPACQLSRLTILKPADSLGFEVPR